MSQNRNLEQFLIKKSYEICYALVRISSSVKSEGFARRLEENGLLLLEAAASGEFGRMSRISAAVEYLLRLGSDAGILHHANADVISQELNYLNSAVAEYGNAAKTEEVPLEGIFSESSFPVREFGDSRQGVLEKQEGGDKQNGGSPENGNGSGEFAAGGQRSVVKAAIRQSAILERIRQNGNCRMKEIQEILPDISERTLRYDLQDLIERGTVERTGNGGPATSYRTIQ